MSRSSAVQSRIARDYFSIETAIERRTRLETLVEKVAHGRVTQLHTSKDCYPQVTIKRVG